MEDWHIAKLARLGAVVNTSVSGMDTDAEIRYRVAQAERLREGGVRSVFRVVTCEYGRSGWARRCQEKQAYLLSLSPLIDNPLRARQSNPHVVAGDIVLTRRGESVGGGKYVSLNSSAAYLGTCRECRDQCGVDASSIKITDREMFNENQAAGTFQF
jgi:hypothetical protein